MKKETTKSSTGVRLAVVGASLVGLASAYFFLGPKGKKHQKEAKAWAVKMKADVIEKLEMAREVSGPVYHEIIDSVANEYVKGKKASQEEIDLLARDLKKHWKTIGSTAGAIKKDVKKSAGRVMKKVQP